MRPLDQMPSTADYVRGDDPVLLTLMMGRARVERDWTRSAYISRNGSVCAIGSILCAAGLESKYRNQQDTKSAHEMIEEQIGPVKDAMGLLNQAAICLYPDSKTGGMTYPIEWVNQMFSSYNEDACKQAVLCCYDEAINRRAENATIA